MTDMTHAAAAISMVAPELAAQIEDAPGQGIVPGISPHLAGEAQLFHLDAQPMEKINDLLSRCVNEAVTAIRPLGSCMRHDQD